MLYKRSQKKSVSVPFCVCVCVCVSVCVFVCFLQVLVVNFLKDEWLQEQVRFHRDLTEQEEEDALSLSARLLQSDACELICD